MAKESKANAGSYERVSSDEQAREGFSLEVQGEKNTGFIISQGWTLHDRYIDPGKSGKNLNRPDMKRLLSDINLGKINIVVVHKLDRLTRNIGDLHQLLSLFDQKEIKLVSISENIDTSSAMGRMFVYMLGIFAQWYRENLSEEVVKGQTKRAELGLRNSSHRPYGYEVGDNLVLTVDEDEARIVRQLFKWFVSGWGIKKIARIMNTTGIDGDPIPSKNNGLWHEITINTILRNPTYTGATHWKPKNEPEDKRIIVHDVHEPIISLEQFEETQNIIKRRSENNISISNNDFPFSTIVKCGECGRSYHGYDQGRYKTTNWNNRNYRCSGKYAPSNQCKDGSGISEPKMAKLFLEFLDNFTFTTRNPDTPIEGRDVEKDRKKLTRLLEESAMKRKNYTRAMGNGKIPYEEFEELIDEENKKATKWAAELEQLQDHQPNKRSRKDVLQLINNLSEKWNEMDHDQRKFAVQQLFEVIVIKKQDKKWMITGYKLAD